MIHQNILLIESLVDSDRPDRLEHLELLWPVAAPLVGAFMEGDWRRVYRESDRFQLQARSVQERAFGLQWPIAASEIEYDLERRGALLREFTRISRWYEDPYADYLKAYFDGVGAYFASYLKDAELRFQGAYELANRLDYNRGRLRCLFHLGLVAQLSGYGKAALDYLFQAREIGRILDASGYLKRVEAVIRQAGASSSSGDELERLLIQGEMDRARRILAEREIARRRNRVKRKSESLGVYLCALFWRTGKSRLARRVFESFDDPMVQIRALEIKERVLGLESCEMKELQVLRERNFVATLVRQSSLSPDETEILGRPVRLIEDEAIRKAIVLLVSSGLEGASKDRICQAAWGLEYDPLHHDGKVHKLIAKTRKYFNCPNLILNGYGTYRLNPSFLKTA